MAREIEVTRRLYRSGESEYLIDGSVCRLRDVHDLLMDTGLGAKNYAIIEQGKIGMILSTRPTDRRQLIEEAAGVTKYKARRRAAELKLEAAQQNLTRIDDIVFEVEKQRGTLKRQAGKARRYQRLRDELRRWEKVLFARKYRQLAETIESARARLSEARERESAVGGTRRRSGGGSRPSAHRAGRSGVAVDAITRGGACPRAGHHPTRTATGLRSRAGPGARPAHRQRRPPSSRDSRRAASRRAWHSPARREAAAEAAVDRERAAANLAAESAAYEAARRELEGLEADVEAARGEVFSALNSATALRHALEHAAAARDRVGETLSKLDIEASDIRIESERVVADARPPPTASAALTTRSKRRGLRERLANPSWRARASSTNGVRDRSALASTSSRASPLG